MAVTHTLMGKGRRSLVCPRDSDNDSRSNSFYSLSTYCVPRANTFHITDSLGDFSEVTEPVRRRGPNENLSASYISQTLIIR